ncbi:MAG: isoleucine--tRNA ligase [Gemmataceae bacterium]
MSHDYKATIHLPQTAFAMKGDLPKREPEMLAAWYASDLYGRIQAATAGRPTSILHDGPPYANGDIHIGHAVNKVLKDIVVRSRLLAGFRSPYVPGWDCHGLPIEHAVEKEIGKVGQKVGAAEFRVKCREYATRQIDVQRAGFKRLGVLGDWDHSYRTMDFRFEADTLRALARIIANGHLSRGVKPVHWCFDCGSALAEAEIEYENKTSPAIDVAYPVIGPDTYAERFGVDRQGAAIALPIWTTTPWTLPASLAVTLHPDFDYVLVEGPKQGDSRRLLILAADLAASALARYGIDTVTELGRVKGAALEGLLLQHPFYARQVPVILGDHVTTDAGTGAVHTAPGHGQEDFAVGQKYGLEVLNPVGGNGVFLPATEIFAGEHVWKANDHIIEVLGERGALLASRKLEHSYPHCWRHKTPVAFRATPQWFISMDQAQLRAQALAAIGRVRWQPAWGEERIRGMIANRPDWCISRQRTWGVPIALLIDKQTGEPHPRSVELMRQVADQVELAGADAWYALDIASLIGDEADDYEKVTDILDVWFDSGVTHYGVVNSRLELSPEHNDLRSVMYLEGSDQHRGWFHSSLLTAVAMTGGAPYNEVITHGFTVDEQGRKMSKSQMNGVAPKAVSDSLGADVMRLWVASTDYAGEMAVSDGILKRVADSYRRLRNTARFLLGNLAGFDPARDLVAPDRMLLLDRWALAQAVKVMQVARRVYGPEAHGVGGFGPDTYAYQVLVQELMRFATVDMGAGYLDMTKDRLYTLPEAHPARRSAQSAMYWTLEILVRALGPILAFTADEVWKQMPGRVNDSVLFSTWAELDHLNGVILTADEVDLFADLEALRSSALKQIEVARNAKTLGGSLEAKVALAPDAAAAPRLAPYADELRFYFITSDVEFVEPAAGDEVTLSAGKVKVGVAPSGAPKCVRCWHLRGDVGRNAEHPELCGRCVTNVAGGGEQRRWF